MLAGAVVAVALVILAALVGYVWFLGGSGEASVPISASTLVSQAESPAVSPTLTIA